MPRFCPALLLCATLLLSCATAGGSPAADSPVLPLRTLRIYESGVGYFERTGRLSRSSATTLPVPASHLDDALKTLVILNRKGEGSVQGLEFSSRLSQGMARAQAGLAMDANAPTTYRTLLEGLKGAQVEMRTVRGTFRGRIVEVIGPPVQEKLDPAEKSPAERKVAPWKEPGFTVVVLTDESILRRFGADEIEWARPTDAVASSRLTALLDANSSRSAQVRRALHLLGEASGEVTIGYIAETPVWQATYRLVLDPSGKSAALQCWGLLHNDTDEDWRAVRVHLVNGRPNSFLYPLAAPRYFRRPMMHPASKLSTVPQLLRTTADAIWGDHTDDEEEDDADNVLGNLVGNEIGEAYGVGGLGMVGTGAGGGGVGSEIKEMVRVSPAAGVEAAALFIYSLAYPLTLKAHNSALVPVLDSSIEAKSVVWFDQPADTGESVVRLTNSTAQTLPSGPIAFFADGGFAGESALDRLKPGERQYVRHGVDLDAQIKEKSSRREERVENVTFETERLVEHVRVKQSCTHELENRSAQERTLALVLAAGKNAIVTGADETDIDWASSHAVALFRVAARTRTERLVTTEEEFSRGTHVFSLTWKQLQALEKLDSLSAKTREDLSIVAQAQHALETAVNSIDSMKKELAEVEEDLARLRKHLEALGDNAGGGGAARFIKRILAGEDQLNELRRRQTARAKDVETLRTSLRAALEKLAKA